jgi:hypothetical protein
MISNNTQNRGYSFCCIDGLSEIFCTNCTALSTSVQNFLFSFFQSCQACYQSAPSWPWTTTKIIIESEDLYDTWALERHSPIQRQYSPWQDITNLPPEAQEILKRSIEEVLTTLPSEAQIERINTLLTKLNQQDKIDESFISLPSTKEEAELLIAALLKKFTTN